MRFLVLVLTTFCMVSFATASEATPIDQRDLATLEGECAGGDSASCDEASKRYSWGRGVAADAGKAEKYNRMACETGSGSACTLYAVRGNRGDKGYPKLDQKTVADYALKGCRGGDTVGCNMARSVVNSGYFSDSDRAFLLGQGAKTASAAPAPKPASTGNRWLDECNAGSAAYCNNYAISLANNKDHAGALKYYQKACQMGSQTGCTNAKNRSDYAKAVAAQAATSNANSADRRSVTTASGLADLKQRCDAGNALGCSHYAYNLGVAKQWQKAIPYAERGCQLGDQTACQNAGIFARNHARNVEYEQRRQERLAQQKAWEEQQRQQASSYVPSGRRTRDHSYSPGGYVGSGSGSTSTYKPREQVCTESYTGGGIGVNGKGSRIVTCR